MGAPEQMQFEGVTSTFQGEDGEVITIGLDRT